MTRLTHKTNCLCGLLVISDIDFILVCSPQSQTVCVLSFGLYIKLSYFTCICECRQCFSWSKLTDTANAYSSDGTLPQGKCRGAHVQTLMNKWYLGNGTTETPCQLLLNAYSELSDLLKKENKVRKPAGQKKNVAEHWRSSPTVASGKITNYSDGVLGSEWWGPTFIEYILCTHRWRTKAADHTIPPV